MSIKGPISLTDWQKNVIRVEKEEAMKDNRWHYFSFASDTGFLGGVFLHTKGLLHGLLEMKKRGIKNPGGEVLCVVIPENTPMPPEGFTYRLLTKEEVLSLGCEKVGD